MTGPEAAALAAATLAIGYLLGWAVAMEGAMDRLLRILWAGPWTVVGLVLGVILGGLSSRWELGSGAVHVVVGTLVQRWMRARFPAAVTLGHVVLYLHVAAAISPRVLRHELEHVRQYERWGVLFVPVYLLASLWALARGGQPHHDNAFETAARAAEVRL